MRLRTNVIYNSLLTCSNYIFQLITFPYVSRVLGVDNIGACNFVISIINYVILFSTMGISILGIREIAKCQGNREKLNQCFSSLFYLNLISTVVVLGIYLLMIFFIPALLPYRKLLYIGIMQIVANLFLIEWFFKGIENFKYITIRNVIVRLIYVLLVYILVREKSDFHIYFILTIGIVVINGIINWQYRRNYVNLVLQNISLKKYFVPFIVLGIYMLLTGMYTSFNVIYLGFIAGDTEVGYYTTASKLYTVILGLFTAFTGVMLPRMSTLVEANCEIEIKRLSHLSFNLLFAFSIPLVFFCTVFAPHIINLLAGNGYEGALLPMRIIMPLVILIGMEQILIVQLLMPLKKDKAIFINSLIGAFIGIFTNLLLVGKYHCIGSSCVWVLSELGVFCSAYFFITRIPLLKGVIPWRGLLTNVLCCLPLLGLYIVMLKMGYESLLCFFLGIIITVVYIIIVQCKVIKNELFISTIAKIKFFC